MTNKDKATGTTFQFNAGAALPHNRASEMADRIATTAQPKIEIELIVTKQRMGRTGTVKAFCDMGASFIGDAEVAP